MVSVLPKNCMWGSTWSSEQTITVTGVNTLAGISMGGDGNYLALGTLENGGTDDRKYLSIVGQVLLGVYNKLSQIVLLLTLVQMLL